MTIINTTSGIGSSQIKIEDLINRIYSTMQQGGLLYVKVDPGKGNVAIVEGFDTVKFLLCTISKRDYSITMFARERKNGNIEMLNPNNLQKDGKTLLSAVGLNIYEDLYLLGFNYNHGLGLYTIPH